MFVNHIEDGSTVYGESGMFAACDQVKLLYKASKVIKVYNQVTNQIWQENIDWRFDAAANAIVRLPGSSMPAITAETISPPNDKAIYYPDPGANAVPGRVGGGNVLFDAKSFFAENQIEVDYIAAGTQTFLPGLEANCDQRLPRFRTKLARKENVRIVALGDSINEGYN